MWSNIMISIVIPVYNVEKYLDTCLNSIVNQTFKDLEIIDNELGKPELRRHPRQRELNAFVSISHTDELVMTEVILEKKG